MNVGERRSVAQYLWVVISVNSETMWSKQTQRRGRRTTIVLYKGTAPLRRMCLRGAGALYTMVETVQQGAVVQRDVEYLLS